MTPPSIPEMSALMMVLAAVLGGIYALRKQDFDFREDDFQSYAVRLRQLEAANSYLLEEVEKLKRENHRLSTAVEMFGDLEKRYDRLVTDYQSLLRVSGAGRERE